MGGQFFCTVASTDDSKDPISAKKLNKGKGTFDTKKCLLGFDFDGVNKTIWLEEAKRDALLTILHQWIRGATKANRGIPFAEFESVTAKLQHAFTALREGRVLLSPCNWVIKKRPRVVYLHKNRTLLEAIKDIRTILRASTVNPTKCKDLVAGLPDYIGIVDASSHGVGGVVIGELSSLPPTVFRLKWPDDISRNLVSFDNPSGMINNSDLEMAGLQLLWLCIEGVAPNLAHKHIALFSDNSPDGQLGHQNGFQEIKNRGTARTSPRAAPQRSTSVPAEPCAHTWNRKRAYGHPITLVWKRT